VGKLDSGGIVSFSIWDTANEAQHAVDLAASWVKDNLADRIKFARGAHGRPGLGRRFVS
jgi:hypothetical protein